MGLIFGIIIGFVVIVLLIYFCCYYPRKYNKYVYAKYGIINLISLKNNIKAFIPFAVGACFISGDFGGSGTFTFLSILGAIVIGFSAYLACYPVNVSNISEQDKHLGYLFSILSMIGVVVCVFNILNEVNSKNKSIFEKVIGTGIFASNIFVFRPDLKAEEFQRIDLALKNHPNIDVKKIRFN